MNHDLNNARNLLEQGDYTCVLSRGDALHTATERGVKPLLNWLDGGLCLEGFSAADRVVGRATAFLYVLLEVKAVYSRVMSRPAAQVLAEHGIDASWDTLVEGIVNRRGDGPCPFEAAVLNIRQPRLALFAIRQKSAVMAATGMVPGIQVSSVKPLLLTQEQVDASFARMQALGCRGLQLQWIDPSVSIEAIAASMEKHGLFSVSVQDFYETIRENFAYYRDLNTATGGKWLCVSRIPDRCKSPEGLKVYVAELRQMQQQLDAVGQTLCFHPVSADYAALPDRNAVEALMTLMPELEICLDLYHLGRSCPDMPGFIRRWAGRICMVHFKDCLGDTLVPAGQGEIPWEGVVSACLEAGVPWGFVEQERWDRDPFLCLGEALDWLRMEIQTA